MHNERDRIQFSESDLELVEPAPALNLPDLHVVRCLKPKSGVPYMIFDCTPAHRHKGGCSACGSTNIIKHGSAAKKRVVHDINVGLTRVDLMVTIPRYRCKDCNAVTNHTFDCMPEGRHMTYRLHEQIRKDAFLRPFSQVADDFGYSEGTIRSIFDEYAAELEAKRGPIVAPEVLGIDEKHIVNEMRGVFVDVQTGRLLEMTPSNKKSDIIGTIEKMVDYDKNIKIVTTDMANSYKSYIEECLPQAKLIVDKYHVYQDLYRKVNRTKSILMERIGKRIKEEQDPAIAIHLRDVRDLLVRNAYLFKFGREKLTEKPERIKAMADVCDTFPEFNHLRLIKEGFERVYEAYTKEEAERRYQDWVPLIPPTGIHQIEKWEAEYGVQAELFLELRAFYRTTKKWYKEILNYFEFGCQFTNAAAEGTNSLIQRINGMGAGYGFSHLRAKALFWRFYNTRCTYSFKTTKKNSKSSFNDLFGGGGNSLGWLTVSETSTHTEIVRDKKQTRFTDLSVFHYLPQNAEYYDFNEGEEYAED